MPVSQILLTKGPDVISAPPTAKVADVAKTLSDNRIGAVLITGVGNTIAGIVSERDVVRAIATSGPSVLSEPVSMIMTRDVKTCSSADNEETLVTLMTNNRIRHLPVVDAGKLVGMISIGDVVKFRMLAIERESDELKDYIRSAG
jgi:CBS domain-containing protein